MTIMTKPENTTSMKNIKNIIRRAFLTSMMAGMCGVAFADLQPVSVPGTGYMYFNGNYDIKMVSSVALQPAWISSTNPMTVVDIMTNEEMFGAGDDNALNNRFDWGFTGKSAQAAMALNHRGATATSQVYADCDDDMSTFQSSAAFLDFGNNMGCTTIEAAYLYWTGTDGNEIYAAYPGTPTMKSYAGGAVGNTTGYKNVKFKAPGMSDYVDVTAERDVTPSGGGYVCMADVTDYVRGRTGGLFWVANLKSGAQKGEGGARAGWSLVVIYNYPNCAQRVIRFWDCKGTEAKGNGSTVSMDFASGEVPASGNSISYLGFIGLDGEDSAPLIMDKLSLDGTETSDQIKNSSLAIAQKNKITFNGGNGNKDIQPFITDQAPVHACNETGICGDEVYCGFVSSQTTIYDPETGLNGNQVTRLPNNINTLGYDAHHVKLPAGSMAAGATSASMRLPDEQNGDYRVVMAYMAIETQQATLLMDKKSIEASTKPAGEMTYELNIKNVGTKATNGTSTVLDTLDKTLDFVPNSVKFLDKNGAELTTGAFNIINQGADDNEVLTFTVPQIAAGDGSKANDSIRIQFNVKVKGLDRTDIWAYGCNRQVKNKATLIYKNDAGADVETGSNSTGGCDGNSIYFYTPVVDAALEESYLKSHHDTFEANAGSMNVINTLRARLQVHLTDIGLNIDPAIFTFYEEESVTEVAANAVFDVTGGSIDYLAVADLGGGCEETFYFNVKVAKRPSIEVAEISAGVNGQTSYKGKGDGTLQIRVYNGNNPYKLTVYDANGNVAYSGGTSSADYTFVPNVFKAGTYTATAIDSKGYSVSSSTLTVIDPADMTVAIEGVDAQCKYLPLTLNAAVTGRDPSRLEYVWKKDGANVSTSQTYTENSFDTPSTYTLYVCDGGGQEMASQSVNAVPTPKIEVVKSDTGCKEFFLPPSYESALESYNLHQSFPDSIIGIIGVQEVSGDPDIANANLELSYFTPSSVPGRDQVPYNNTEMTKSGKIIARITADGLCYHQDTVDVTIKKFQECYPVVVPGFFSPDDNGINDIFKVEGIDDWHYEAENPEIVVFDRYGKKVYTGNYEDMKKGWDGTYDGKDLPSGDYWYEITYSSIKPKVGHFTLKRRKE